MRLMLSSQKHELILFGSGLCILDKKLDHAALAVGFGKERGEEFWIIKNSWSISWGDEGFIKISAKDDNCGVTQKAVVVKVRTNSDLR